MRMGAHTADADVDAFNSPSDHAFSDRISVAGKLQRAWDVVGAQSSHAPAITLLGQDAEVLLTV